MAKKKLQRISAGVYRDRYGIRAVVHVAAGRKEARFPPDTSLSTVKDWRNDWKVKLAALKRTRPSRAGTLKLDVRRYLTQIKGLASWKSRRSELDAWIDRYGTRPRASLTEA